MSSYDETEASATAARLRAADRPYNERFELLSNRRGELAAIEDRADDETDPPAVPTVTTHAEPLSVDDRLAELERRQALLVLPALEQQRAAELDRLQQSAELFHGLEPAQAIGLVREGARQSALLALGADRQQVELQELGEQAEAIVADALGDTWTPELRSRVIETVLSNGPAWVGPEMTAATVGQAMVSAARMLAEGDYVRSAAEQHRATREQAVTMSGAGIRPSTKSDDDAYWERVRTANTGGYGT